MQLLQTDRCYLFTLSIFSLVYELDQVNFNLIQNDKYFNVNWEKSGPGGVIHEDVSGEKETGEVKTQDLGRKPTQLLH